MSKFKKVGEIYATSPSLTTSTTTSDEIFAQNQMEGEKAISPPVVTGYRLKLRPRKTTTTKLYVEQTVVKIKKVEKNIKRIHRSPDHQSADGKDIPIINLDDITSSDDQASRLQNDLASTSEEKKKVSTPKIGPKATLSMRPSPKKQNLEKVENFEKRRQRKEVTNKLMECKEETNKRIKVERNSGVKKNKQEDHKSQDLSLVNLPVTVTDLEGKTDTDEHFKAVRRTRSAYETFYNLACKEEDDRVASSQKATPIPFKKKKIVKCASDRRTKAEILAQKLKARYKEDKAVSRRPDLKALTMMRTKGMTLLGGKKVVGRIQGILPGDVFFSRVELCVLNLHNHWLNGIEYITEKESPYKGAVCISIVISGGYEDNQDYSEKVWYTGSGKNDLMGNRRQYDDQELKGGNLALMNSMETKNPIRVFRGYQNKGSSGMKTYTFDGMYQVVECQKTKGQSNFYVFKFLMQRMAGQPALTSDQVKFINGEGVPESVETCEGVVCKDLSKGKEKKPIVVTNVIDDPPTLPDSFFYITERVWPKDMQPPNAPKGCKCVGECDPRTCPCKDPSTNSFNYIKDKNDKRLIMARGAILECGPNCKCSKDCTNRNAQLGIRFRLEVYKTAHKGWAVRSWDYIPKGSIVAPYVGEVLHENDLTDNDVYVLNMDTMRTGVHGTSGREAKTDDIEKLSKKLLDDCGKKEVPKDYANCEWVLDAANKGNVARFFNHSCDPNMFYQSTIWEHNDLHFAVPVLVASQNIAAMTELTYDYGYEIGSVQNNDGSIKEMKCHCATRTCRKRLY